MKGDVFNEKKNVFNVIVASNKYYAKSTKQIKFNLNLSVFKSNI